MRLGLIGGTEYYMRIHRIASCIFIIAHLCNLYPPYKLSIPLSRPTLSTLIQFSDLSMRAPSSRATNGNIVTRRTRGQAYASLLSRKLLILTFRPEMVGEPLCHRLSRRHHCDGVSCTLTTIEIHRCYNTSQTEPLSEVQHLSLAMGN
jgi:hypothetical protein